MLPRLLLPGLLFAAGLTVLSAPAAAEPPPWAGHGKHHGREWREEHREWERHEARRSERRGYDAPAPAYAPPPYYAPPSYPAPYPYPVPSPTPGIGVFVPFR